MLFLYNIMKKNPSDIIISIYFVYFESLMKVTKTKKEHEIKIKVHSQMKKNMFDICSKLAELITRVMIKSYYYRN